MDGTATITLEPFQLGLMAHGMGNLAKAAEHYRETIAQEPAHLMAHVNLGSILFEQRDFVGAISIYEAALKINPDSSPVHSSMGAALNALGRNDEAGAHYMQGVALDPLNFRAISNYADWLTIQGRHEEAIAQLRTALRLSPGYAHALCILGTAYCALDRYVEGTIAFRSAIVSKPDLWKARKNLGMVLLQRGQFAVGWQEWDWRFLADNMRLRPLTTPVWDGLPLGGELLICCEQGLGDQILYASMARDLLVRTPRVVWEVEPRLLSLFQRAWPEIRFIPRAAPGAPPTDPGSVAAQFPAGSLGRLLRNDVSHFPGSGYLKADPSRVAEIAAKLNLAPGEKLVGISWRSDNKSVGHLKSASFADFAPLLEMPGVRFVSLQYGADESGLGLDGLNVTHDLEGLAALISLCDAVVTVSNTNAHLAGALGVPVLVLVGAGRAKQWMWGTQDCMPWYATARMIRQRRGAPWSAPINAAVFQLYDFLKEA